MEGSVVDMSFAEVLALGSPTPKEEEYFNGSQPKREQVTLRGMLVKFALRVLQVLKRWLKDADGRTSQRLWYRVV